MNGLDAHLSHQLAQYQATIDANQEPEPYTPTHMEKAFMESYRSNVAIASVDEVLFFLQNKEDAPDSVRDEMFSEWVSIEDAYLVWLDAIAYARSAA
jgi:hypothetical protein